MFITIDDLYSKVRQSDLRQITGGNDSVSLHAIGYAVGLIRSYLGGRYDTERIFSAQGEQREGMLVSIAVDIAIYEIVAICQPNIDLTDRRERRNQAVEYLRQVRDDSLPTGWPLLPEPDPGEGSGGPVEYGGRPPRDNYFG